MWHICGTPPVFVALPPRNSAAKSADRRRVASFLGTRGRRKGLVGSRRSPVAPGFGRNVAGGGGPPRAGAPLRQSHRKGVAYAPTICKLGRLFDALTVFHTVFGMVFGLSARFRGGIRAGLANGLWLALVSRWSRAGRLFPRFGETASAAHRRLRLGPNFAPFSRICHFLPPSAPIWGPNSLRRRSSAPADSHRN